MIRKCSCIVCAVYMLMVMGVQVKASQHVGMLQVIPSWCGQSIAGGTVSLSLVGSRTEEGIVLTDGLANWYVDEWDLKSGDWINWLAQHTEGRHRSAVIRSGSGAVFEDLTAGIYLVEQTGNSEAHLPFVSFLQEIPENGYWNLTVRPKLIYDGEPPKTGDRPAPIIGAMGIGLSAAIMMVLADSRKK